MIVDAQCNRCRHLDRGELERSGMLVCTAFRVGVPTTIQLNEFDHRQPFAGDHGIRFEPLEAFNPLRRS